MDNLTDINLFARIERDDKKAFDELFFSFYRDLCRFALIFLGDKDNSEEVVQRVFVRIWEQRKRLAQPENTKSYLFRSVYNECLKSLRSQSAQKRCYENYYVHFLKESADTQMADIEIIIPYLNAAIEKLPERCRQIFILNKMEGMKQREIAELLNISTKTVENQVAIAISKLRTELQPVIHLLPASLFFLKFF